MSQLSELIRASESSRPGRLEHVHEWGQTVLVTGLPAIARLEASKLAKGGDVDPVEFTALALSRSLRDPKTKACIFSKEEARALLEEDTSPACDRLLNLILQISGLLPGSVEKAKADFLGMPSSATPSS